LERSPSTAVVAEATTYEATLLAAEEHGPDVVVIDLDLGDDTTKGLEICEDITNRLGVKVLVLAPTLSEMIVTESLRRGATGYLVKNEVTSDELVHAVRSVQQGETAFGRGVGAMITKALVTHKPESSAVSAREIEILKLVAQGLSNKQIAHQLYISESTVKFHLHNASKKLHAIRRAEIVHRAMAQGLI
jgi:DNA-binding NarL/FixJ family response regulator